MRAALHSPAGGVALHPSCVRRGVEQAAVPGHRADPAQGPGRRHHDLVPPRTQPLDHARPAAPGPAVPAQASLTGITGREREVLALIATGLSNSEIAARLCISEATAKTHVGHLLTKLNARDRVHLVILAFQAGLVSA